jgi:NAD+ synthase (glutamine-hydrolysing)
MRKSYSNGWVLSLSGGADSSAIASLCYLAIRLASSELGIEGVRKSLSHFHSIQECDSEQGILQKALTTVYQGTRNSSTQTRNSANKLAENVGSTHYEIEIDELVASYTGLIEGAIGRKLTWATDDITLQNVQARVRAPSAWMLANIQNGLLLATSNRSEASVGYATMDGDTSGSISPIAGIDKTFIREWLKWMEKIGVDGIYHLPALQYVNQLEPSAELRPLDTKQVDEEDLMPYPILNFIEKSAFRNKNAPDMVFEELKEAYASVYSASQLWEFANRFFRLWARNQWKRERYAPGFHVDDYSLDPKSWLRFPILSAGLAKDLPKKP